MRLLFESASEAHPDASAANLRILLVAYHFPPSTVVGALRWEKLVHLLSAEGFLFDVLTLDPLQLSRVDELRLKKLPAGSRVFAISQPTPVAEQAWNWLARTTKKLRSSAPSPTGANVPATSNPITTEQAPSGNPVERSTNTSFRKRINARLHVSHELAWARSAAAAGAKLAKSHAYQAVVTSGPPHYVHDAGYQIGRDTGIPHIPDFRDPWRLAESAHPDLDVSFISTSDIRHESRVVENAAFIVMNTEAAAVQMRTVYPSHARKIIAVMNGSDPEDRVESPARERFTLLYAGSLYLQRDPRVLFRACAPLIQRLSLTPSQFAIQFLGPSDTYAGRAVSDLAADFGLRDHVIVSGMVPRSEALKAAAAATQLVCLPDGQRLTIPAKLFEYVQLDSWLLAFADADSAMAMALRDTDADVVTPGDTDAAARCILARWERFTAGERPTAPGADGRFSRSTQAARFSELFRSARLPRG